MKRAVTENPWLSGMAFLFIIFWIINYFWGVFGSYIGLGAPAALGILTVIYFKIYNGIKYRKWDFPLLSYYSSLFLIIIAFYMISGLLGKELIGLLIIMPLVLFLLINLVIWFKA